MDNEIHILDLSWRARASGGGQLNDEGFWAHPKVPFLIVNCVFRCDPGYYHDKAAARSRSYKQVVQTGTPEEEEASYQASLEEHMVARESEEGFDQLADWISRLNREPRKPMVWTYDDPLWHSLDKFNAFWFREWVADSPVTRAVLQELRLYQIGGSTGSVYRSTEEEIVLRHLETLSSYWD